MFSSIINVLRLTCLAILIISNQAIAKSDNPFDKSVIVTAGSDVRWQYGEQTATKSVKAEDGTWYHLFYDGIKLRLRLTGSAKDSEADARAFGEFAVKDVKVDGKRLKVFQWCLSNQEKHNRFLQQGLKVKKNICRNQGEQGAFVMRMTRETVAALVGSGKVIEFDLKPYRTMVRVRFNISDFDSVNKEFLRQQQAKLAASKPPVVAKVEVVAVAPKPKPKCLAKPPTGYAEVNAIEFDCDNASAKERAQSEVNSQVASIREQRKMAAVEAERIRKQEEAERLAREEARIKEQEVLAASVVVQAELSSDIAKKMIPVCQKQWADGKHRCYCEKYIEYAPPEIQSNSSCK